MTYGQQPKQNPLPEYWEIELKKAKDRFPNYESICTQCGTTIYKPFKELTDDELFKVYADLEEVYTGNNFPVDLGRAILRKAQEK
jgi:hypothetical protein